MGRSLSLSLLMQLTPEMEGENIHFKVEREKMGTRHVYVHLIIFTQFGMHKEELRRASISWDTCCVCSRPTRLKKKIPSLCLRVMGGTAENSRDWEYTLVFAVCCGACKPKYIRNFSTILLRKDDIARVDQFIDEHAFQGRCVQVENFLYGSREDHGSVFHALIDNYLWRLNVINSKVPAMCRLLFEVNECFFCKGTRDIQKCDKCKCISYCNMPACLHKLKWHHLEICLALSRGRLFHVDTMMDTIFYVERSVEGRCLQYKPETLEISEEEIEELKAKHG